MLIYLLIWAKDRPTSFSEPNQQHCLSRLGKGKSDGKFSEDASLFQMRVQVFCFDPLPIPSHMQPPLTSSQPTTPR